VPKETNSLKRSIGSNPDTIIAMIPVMIVDVTGVPNEL
jgi:hypothetical protein